jgi:hypothetical protein
MFKRFFWMMIGLGLGFGLAWFITRFVKETVSRYAPEKVSNDVAKALQSFGQDVRAAVADGREGMREYEANLRAQLEGADQARR